MSSFYGTQLHSGLGGGWKNINLERWETKRYIISDQGKNFCCEDGIFIYSHNFRYFVSHICFCQTEIEKQSSF